MTWWRGKGRYEVFFNRDELKTRSHAQPPMVRSTEKGTRYLSPTDPDAGGTWMLCNEHAVTVCLLNRWHESSTPIAKSKSRGLLVLGFADCINANEVITKLQLVNGPDYKPFTLVAIDPQNFLVQVWDGKQMFSEKGKAPLTSSSYCFPEVRKLRRESYAALSDDKPETLRGYQAGISEPSAFTVRMNRPDAQTWSRSHIVVGAAEVTWQYLEEFPNLEGDPVEHTSSLGLKR